MIKSLGEHGVLASDLAPSLVTTQQIENPDFDPVAAQEKQEAEEAEEARQQQQIAGQPEEAASQDVDSATKSNEAPAAADSGKSDSMKNEAIDDDDGDIATSGHRKKARPDNLPAQLSAVPKSDVDESDIAGAFTSGSRGSMNPDALPAPELTTTNSSKAPQSHLAVAAEPALADPNTAAQTAAAEANATGTSQNHLGLTSEPQSISPPPNALPGVTTELSITDSHITLDLRWTVLCDLFLVLTADSVYDARSRVLLEKVAEQLGLSWMDVTKFEKRVTDALEIEEGVEKLKDKAAISNREKEAKRKKWAMVGLATVGGGLVIGLSAGLAAPLVGVGLAGLLGGVGIGGTSAFLGGAGGAVLITTTGTAAGAALGGRGMTRRTQSVKTFMFKPIHNNKRINCIVTVPGFMNGPQDDVRLPFSVIDSIMGDVFSVLWEPEMMREMGNAINILWNETIVAGVQGVLAATIAGGLLGALAWPLWLTKLGYLIDNPWSNALTRAEAAGKILADILSRRHLGVRPITLVGFSLGARVIFYALCELAKKKAFGVVQNVYMFGAPVTASDKTWKEARSVVAGRFVNGFSSTDWILGYLFRATSGGLRSIAGLHPVERVPEVENIDVTTSVPGHLQYRAFMPLVLSEVGFRVTQDWFDEPEDLSKIPDREVVLQEKQDQDELELKTVKTQSGGFGKIWKRRADTDSPGGRAPGSGNPSVHASRAQTPLEPDVSKNGKSVDDGDDYDDDLPPREDHSKENRSADSSLASAVGATQALDEESAQAIERSLTPEADKPANQSAHFDTNAILSELRDSGIEVRELESSLPALTLSDGRKASSNSEPSRIATTSSVPSNATPFTASGSATIPARSSSSSSKPSLKASVSSFFSRKGSVGTSPVPATRSPLTVAPPILPTLAAPSGTYSSGGQPSASAERESATTPRGESPSYLSQSGGEDEISSPTATVDQGDGRGRLQTSQVVSGPDTTALQSAAIPAHKNESSTSAATPQFGFSEPTDAALGGSVNLSFASDFDDDDDDDTQHRTEQVSGSSAKTLSSAAANAQTYGLSAEAAAELARQFGGGRVEQSGGLSSQVTSNPSFDDWGASNLPSHVGSRRPAAATDGGWNDESTPPSSSVLSAAPSLRPLESTYGSSARPAASSDDFAATLKASRGSNHPRTPGGASLNFEEATENPWG